MQRRRRRWGIVAALIGLAVLAAACGDPSSREPGNADATDIDGRTEVEAAFDGAVSSLYTEMLPFADVVLVGEVVATDEFDAENEELGRLGFRTVQVEVAEVVLGDAGSVVEIYTHEIREGDDRDVLVKPEGRLNPEVGSEYLFLLGREPEGRFQPIAHGGVIPYRDGRTSADADENPFRDARGVDPDRLRQLSEGAAR